MRLAPAARSWLAAGVCAGVLASLATVVLGILTALVIADGSPDVFTTTLSLNGAWRSGKNIMGSWRRAVGLLRTFPTTPMIVVHGWSGFGGP